MGKKTVQPKFNFETVDWTQIDQIKAELIYEEAKDVQRGIFESFAVLNSKAFNFLTLAMAMISAIIGYVLIEWAHLSVPLLVAAATFSGLIFISILCFIVCVWPKGVVPASAEPMAYLENGYYRNDYLAVIKGNIRAICGGIDHNKAVEYHRKFWFQFALMVLTAAPVGGLLAFSVTLAFV